MQIKNFTFFSNKEETTSTSYSRKEKNAFRFSSSSSSSSFQDQDIFERFRGLVKIILAITIPIGGNEVTTIQGLIDNRALRDRLQQRIKRKLKKRVNQLPQNLKDQYHEVMSHEAVQEALRIQQKHFSLKIISYILKIINALAKTSLVPYGNQLKDTYKLFNLLLKATNIKDSVDLFNRLREVRNNPKHLYYGLKSVYSCLSIFQGTIYVLSENELTKLAYEAAGWGSHFNPIPMVCFTVCDTLNTPLTLVKVCIKIHAVAHALKAWRKQDNQTIAYKKRKKKYRLIKSSLELTGETAKLAAKVAIIATGGTLASPILSSVVIFCIICSASLGWYQTYHKRPPSDDPN